MSSAQLPDVSRTEKHWRQISRPRDMTSLLGFEWITIEAILTRRSSDWIPVLVGERVTQNWRLVTITIKQ